MPLVKVILFPPTNVKETSEAVVDIVETSIPSDVASAAPVGMPVEPNVPLCVYIFAYAVPVGLLNFLI